MKYRYMIIGAALLMLAGCTVEEEADTSGLVPISPTMEIEGVTDGATRAATNLLNAFGNGEQLGIALTNCVNASGSALASTTYTMGTGFAAQPYISPDQTATIKGYYPSSARTATSFTVSDNQTSDANYKASDLMYAEAEATKTSSSPTLTFTHKMAKLIVNVTPASGVSSITSVTLNNISRTVGFAASIGELGVLSSSGNITMSNEGAALIPPQTTSESNNFLTIVTDAGTAYYKLGKAFSGGNVYTLNISVGLSDIGLTTTITGWSGNESSVTVNPTVVNTPLTVMNCTISNVGWLIANDGYVYQNVSGIPSGKSAVAMICYVGSAGTADASGNYRGLAIGLNDALDNSESSIPLTGHDCLETYHNSFDDANKGDLNGIKYTMAMINNVGTNSTSAYAARAAANNNGTTAPSGTSGWFLPTIGQWNLMLKTLIGGSGLELVANDAYKADKLNAKFTAVGLDGGTGTGGNGVYASQYQSSSDYGEDISYWTISFSQGCANRDIGSNRVRSVVAF